MFINLVVPTFYFFVLMPVFAPRPSHSYRKYQARNLEDSDQDMRRLTALELLENKLLRLGDARLRKRSFDNNRGMFRDKSCSSFGDQSPLCKTKILGQPSKYFKRSLLPRKRHLSTHPSTSSFTTIEDFFRLFVTNSTSTEQTTSNTYSTLTLEKRTLNLTESLITTVPFVDSTNSLRPIVDKVILPAFEKPAKIGSAAQVAPNDQETVLIPLLSTSLHDKAHCESERAVRCICYIENLVLNFNIIFAAVKNKKSALASVAKLNCDHYVPSPLAFMLSDGSKPRVLSSNRKPMAVDNEAGPKEIEPSSLDEFIKQSATVEDDVTYVFVNTDVKLPCFPTADVHLSASDADQVQFTWTYGNKKGITEGRITENFDGEGTLLITDVSLSDSETYTCDVTYINPDTGHRTEESFKHVINVVTLPIVTVRVSVHYKSNFQCDASLLEMFELYLPQKLETVICDMGRNNRLCLVDIHSTVCRTQDDDYKSRAERKASVPSSPFENPYWLRVKRQDSTELSLNFEVYIHRQAERSLSSNNASMCDAKCHLLTSFKLLKLFKESAEEVAHQAAVSMRLNNANVLFQSISPSVKVKYILGCIGGYQLDRGFCVACPVHTYSEYGATECVACPPRTYQGNIGARKCIPCTYEWIPLCNEYFQIEETNIIIVIVVLVVVGLLLLAFALWYKIAVRQKALKLKLRPTKEKHTPKTAKFTQSQRVRVKKPENVELKPLLDTSTDGESAVETYEEVEEPTRSRSKKRRDRRNKLKEHRTPEPTDTHPLLPTYRPIEEDEYFV